MSWTGQILSAASIGANVFLIIIVLACLGGLGAYIFHLMRFKHKFRIKEITGTKTIVHDDKAREFKDQDGVVWWQLLRRKHVIAPPPADCVDVTTRGHKSVEAFYTEEAGYMYEKSPGNHKDKKCLKNAGYQLEIPGTVKDWFFFRWHIFQQKHLGLGKYIYIKDARPDTAGTSTLSTKQKVILVNQLTKAKLRKGVSLREHIPLIVGASFLVVILVVFFMFFDDIAKPMSDISASNAKISEENQQTVRMLQEMIQKKQIVPVGMATATPNSGNFTPPS